MCGFTGATPMRSSCVEMRAFVIAAAFVCVAAAQQPAAPTPERAGSEKGETWGDYNIVDSFETGYRFATVGGNPDEYRSSVNYGNGVRLFNGYFNLKSKDGHGRFFDDLVITTQDLGNDPYQSATVHLQKYKLYRYDMTWRLNDYFNPGLVTGGQAGQHLLNTQYTLQDHDFTLFPDSNFKFFLGFTNSAQTGPALSSIQEFDINSPVSPLFENVRRFQREYRVGNEFKLFGVRVNWMRGWEDFKEDTPFSLAGGDSLSTFRRAEPYHGTSPYWRVALFSEGKRFAWNGRFTYTAGSRDFVLDETAIGTTRFGAAQNVQTLTFGNARRPVATGNLNVSLLASPKLTLTNSTAVYNVRTSGNSYFAQYNDATAAAQVLFFEYLGIRTIANDTTLDYAYSRRFGLFADYEYSNRRIASVEQTTVGGVPSTLPVNQTNQLNTGRLGLRFRPVMPLSITISGEIGRNDEPFAPRSDRDYHAINARADYRRKGLLLSAGAQTNYNVNSVALSSYSTRSRHYFASGSWTARDWLTLDGSFSRQHLYTIGGIAYFANAQFITGEDSVYLSNLNTVTFGAQIALAKRADLYLGYSRVQDLGDGRNTPFGSGIGSALPAFQAAQTLPLTYQSPLARLSFRITGKLRWNFGYQYYGYREDFYLSQSFRAHTGYSSLSWSF